MYTFICTQWHTHMQCPHFAPLILSHLHYLLLSFFGEGTITYIVIRQFYKRSPISQHLTFSYFELPQLWITNFKYTKYTSLCSYTPSTCSTFHCVPILQVHAVRFTVFLYSKYTHVHFTVFLYSKYTQYTSLCSYTPSTHMYISLCSYTLSTHTCTSLTLLSEEESSLCKSIPISFILSLCSSVTGVSTTTNNTRHQQYMYRKSYVCTYKGTYSFEHDKEHEFRSCFNEKCANSTNSK